MPRFRSPASLVSPAVRQELTDLLAREIADENKPGGPLIFEQEIPQTDTFHVIVVWERWAEMPPENRASVVIDAYERSAPSMVNSITVPIAVTMEEAVELNLLPYQIITLRKKDDSVTLDQLRDAMTRHGGVQTATGLQLRFPSQEMANAALAELQRELPGPWWGMSREVDKID